MPALAPVADATRRRPPTARERLSERLRDQPDFPSLSDAISRVNRLASSDKERVDTVSNAILQDVALTHRILRLANSSYYRLSTTEPITSITHAILLLGFDTVRSLALSLVLFENMPDRGQARRLQAEFLRATMAGSLARALDRPDAQSAEQAYLAGLMFRLGRMLTLFYFPDEAAEIARRVAAGEPEDRAARDLLGVGYETFGLDAARHWGMPAIMLEAIRTPSEREVRQPPAARSSELRLLAACADEITAAVAGRDAEGRSEALEALATRWAPSLGIDADDLRHALARAIRETGEMAAALHVDLRSTPLAPLFGGLPAPRADGRERADLRAGTPSSDGTASVALLHGERLLDDVVLPEGSRPAPIPTATTLPARAHAVPLAGSSERRARLAEALREIVESLASRASPSEAVHLMLAALHRAIGFERSVFLLRDARQPVLTGRTGLGPGIDRLVPQMRVPLEARDHLFAATARKGVDLLIQDSAAPNVAQRLPDDWRLLFGAGTFLLLPMLVRGKPMAMIYADRPQPNSVRITEDELGLLRVLRNELLRAFTDGPRPPAAP